MYRQRAFAVDDPTTLDAFVDAHPFAVVISAGDGAPTVSHVPVLRASTGALLCHLARPNPHCAVLAAGTPATVVFSGPHDYVSPRWYRVAHAVPTWNYSAVHVQVTPREITDAEEIRTAMDAMLEHFEPRQANQPDIREIVDAATVDGMIRGTRTFGFEVGAREGIFKLSQNRSAEDQAGVAGALAQSNPALAELMRRQGPS